MKFQLELGPLGKPIKKQLEDQELSWTDSEEIDKLEADRYSINRCMIHSYMTPSQADKAHNRLFKYIKKLVKNDKQRL